MRQAAIRHAANEIVTESSVSPESTADDCAPQRRVETMAQGRDDLCILLLEDDDADAYLTKRELLNIRRVSKVVRARNGEEAISMLSSGQVAPDLAFVDLQMPTMDGLEFLSQCVARSLANIPMVVLTSSSARQDAIRSRVRGALQVIVKPESVDDLHEALRAAVEAFLPSAVRPERFGQVWSLAPQESPRTPAAASAPVASPPRSFGRRAIPVQS